MQTLTCRYLLPRFSPRVQEEGKREDGRKPTEFRTVSVNTGIYSRLWLLAGGIRFALGSLSSVDGSAVVRIGGECVVCGVRMVSTIDIRRPVHV